eukprot:scaffold22069_cov122-Isochrysis_galbana.AAC.1
MGSGAAERGRSASAQQRAAARRVCVGCGPVAGGAGGVWDHNFPGAAGGQRDGRVARAAPPPRYRAAPCVAAPGRPVRCGLGRGVVRHQLLQASVLDNHIHRGDGAARRVFRPGEAGADGLSQGLDCRAGGGGLDETNKGVPARLGRVAVGYRAVGLQVGEGRKRGLGGVVLLDAEGR